MLYNSYKRAFDFLIDRKTPVTCYQKFESFVEGVNQNREFLILEIEER